MFIKKLIASALIMCAANLSFASDNDENVSSERTMALSISPLALIGGSAEFVFQYKLFDFMSITVPVEGYYSWMKSMFRRGIQYSVLSSANDITKSAEWGKTDSSSYGFLMGVGSRFLMKKRGLSDTFYLEPRVVYKLDGTESKYDGNNFYSVKNHGLGPEAHLGWDWYWNSGFYMNFGFGLGYLFNLSFEPEEHAGLKKLRDDSFLAKWFFPEQSSAGSISYDIYLKLGYSW